MASRRNSKGETRPVVKSVLEDAIPSNDQQHMRKTLACTEYTFGNIYLLFAYARARAAATSIHLAVRCGFTFTSFLLF